MKRVPEPDELMNDAAQARAYAEADFSEPNTLFVRLFEQHLSPAPGLRVLDLGCGPGDTAHRLMKQGFTVDAIDATPAMVSRAREFGVPARRATFAEIDAADLYDGIWANFSLLHAPRADMPAHLARLGTALKPGGRFHIGVKLGAGAKRDAIGRLYTYYTEDELTGLLDAAGFTPTIRGTGRSTGLDGALADWIWIQADG